LVTENRDDGTKSQKQQKEEQPGGKEPFFPIVFGDRGGKAPASRGVLTNHRKNQQAEEEEERKQ